MRAERRRSRRQSARAQRDAARGGAHADGARVMTRLNVDSAGRRWSLARCRWSLRGTRRASCSSTWSANRRARATTTSNTASCRSSSRRGRCRRASRRIAREQLRMQMPGAGRVEVMDEVQAMRARRRRAAAPPRDCARRWCSACCWCCSRCSWADRCYLQRFDNAFLQEQGSSRYSRDIEVPAHRGRIVDRLGDPLAISTPVKAVWAWPDKIEATPEQLRALAGALDMPPAALTQQDRRRRRFRLSEASGCARRRRAHRRAADQGRARRDRILALLPRRRRDEPDPRLHRRSRRRPGRHGARAANLAGRQAREPARDHQSPRRHRRGRREHSRAAGRARPGARRSTAGCNTSRFANSRRRSISTRRRPARS